MHGRLGCFVLDIPQSGCVISGNRMTNRRGSCWPLRSCCLENNLSVDTWVQLFFCSWPFSCSPKKKAEKEGRLPARRTALQAGRSDAAGAAFPRIAPVVAAGASALRTFGAFLGDGAGRNRAEKPLPLTPNRGSRQGRGANPQWSIPGGNSRTPLITPPLRGSRRSRADRRRLMRWGDASPQARRWGDRRGETRQLFSSLWVPQRGHDNCLENNLSVRYPGAAVLHPVFDRRATGAFDHSCRERSYRNIILEEEFEYIHRQTFGTLFAVRFLDLHASAAFFDG